MIEGLGELGGVGLIRSRREPRQIAAEGQEVGVAATGLAQAVAAQQQRERCGVSRQRQQSRARREVPLGPRQAEAEGGLSSGLPLGLLTEQGLASGRLDPHQIPVAQAGMGPPGGREQEHAEGGAVEHRREPGPVDAGVRLPVTLHLPQPGGHHPRGQLLSQPTAPVIQRSGIVHPGRGQSLPQLAHRHRTGQPGPDITAHIAGAAVAIGDHQHLNGGAGGIPEAREAAGVLAGGAATEMGGTGAAVATGADPVVHQTWRASRPVESTGSIQVGGRSGKGTLPSAAPPGWLRGWEAAPTTAVEAHWM